MISRRIFHEFLNVCFTQERKKNLKISDTSDEIALCIE